MLLSGAWLLSLLALPKSRPATFAIAVVTAARLPPPLASAAVAAAAAALTVCRFFLFPTRSAGPPSVSSSIQSTFSSESEKVLYCTFAYPT